MSIDLEQVVLDGGERFVNFFEGRILTGRDLRDEQTAARQGRGALGQAIGRGVVHGLEVTDATPTGGTPAVHVTEGLAVNRDGQTLRLAAARDVRLAELAEDDIARSAGAFGICDDQPTTSIGPTAEGFHILTVAPATAYEQEAPKSGLDDPGTAGGCGRRYVTLGLRFRLVRFDPALHSATHGGEIAALALANGDPALSRLRGLVAHLGLGTERRAGFALAPFSPDAEGGSAWGGWDLEDRLAAGVAPSLMSCEVPLAVLRLRGGSIAFIDMWSVRRRPRVPPQEADWPLIATAGRRGTDEATLFQFQDQLGWLLGRVATPAAVKAVEHFRHLPPVGFLPLAEAVPFLPGAAAPLPLDPGRVIPLVEEALAYPAVDLGASPPPGFLIYRVTGATNWLLFVSDVVPSPEAMARKCAALEDRVAILEETLAAPGVVTGKVTLTYNFGSGSVSQPIPGATVRAVAADDSVTDALTDEDGTYSLTLPAGSYSLVPVFNETPLVGRRIDDVAVLRGGKVTQNFALNLADFSAGGGPG